MLVRLAPSVPRQLDRGPILAVKCAFPPSVETSPPLFFLQLPLTAYLAQMELCLPIILQGISMKAYPGHLNDQPELQLAEKRGFRYALELYYSI